MADPQDSHIICFCHDVTYGELKEIIAKGCDTPQKMLQKIQIETLASTGCGGCEFDIKELLIKSKKQE